VEEQRKTPPKPVIIEEEEEFEIEKILNKRIVLPRNSECS